MIIKHVQHFLNEEGQIFFPQWIKQTKEKLKLFNGFIDLYQAELIDNSLKTTFFFLLFDHAEDLKRWGESQIHEDVIHQLKPYMLKAWIANTYSIANKLA